MTGRAYRNRLDKRSYLEPMDRRVLLAIQPLVDPAPSYPDTFATLGTNLIFAADDGVHGRELWKSDGTAAGTQLLKDIVPGPNGVDSGYSLNELVAVGNKLYFVAPSADAIYNAVWSTDGTTAGTKPVLQLGKYSPTQAFYPLKLVAAGNSIYVISQYYVDNGGGGYGDYTTYDSDPPSYGMHRFNTTTGKVNLISKDFSYGYDLAEIPLQVVGNKLFFAGYDPEHNFELWVTDGVTSHMVKDINAGLADSGIHHFAALNNVVYFKAYDDAHGEELWRSDGTASGTRLVKDINPGEGNVGLSQYSLTTIGNRIYFSGNDGVHGYEPWVTDGTASGTKMLKDIFIPTAAVSEDSGPALFYGVGNLVYFAASTPQTGPELWQTDGTAKVTKLVKDINLGAVGSSPISFAAIGNTLYFAASDGKHGRELWKTNASGTSMVANTNLISNDVEGPNELHAVGSKLFFRGDDGVHGNELWVSDGTGIGTKMVKDIRIPPATITGRLFNDLDHDGRWDAGEVGVKNRKLYLDLNNNLKLDEGEASVVTNSYGIYFFDGLQAGRYIIRQILPAGWNQSSPANNWGFKVTLAASQQYKGAYHATYSDPTKISGHLFSDSGSILL